MGHGLVGHDLAPAVPALFATADAAVTQRLGMSGIEVPTATMRAFEATVGIAFA